MSIRQERAIAAFKTGLSCAQSVVTAYSDVLGFDESLASAIAVGFGSGMGRLQRTCGAATGAFMVLGISNTGKYAELKERKEKTQELIQAFDRQFAERLGATDCRTLLKCDLKTEEGRLFMKDNNLSVTVCQQCIRHAVEIADDLIK